MKPVAIDTDAFLAACPTSGAPAPAWALKTPEEVLADIQTAMTAAMLPERDIGAELWAQLTPSQREEAWSYYRKG